MSPLSRPVMAKLATSVAFGHRSSTASRLPRWSWSSWESTIQRTSTGSTSEKTCSSHAARTRAEPVSTIAGSRPRITRLWAPMYAPDGSAARVGINHVSGVTGWGWVGMVAGIMGRTFRWYVDNFIRTKLY